MYAPLLGVGAGLVVTLVVVVRVVRTSQVGEPPGSGLHGPPPPPWVVVVVVV